MTPEMLSDMFVMLTGIVIGVIGGGGAIAVVNRLGENKQALDAMERLHNSFPPETKDTLADLAMTIDKLGDMLVKVTDGKPNEVDPPMQG